MDAYHAMTEGAALVDRSETGKLALTGPDAKAFLNGQLSNDIEALTPGSGCYAALLTHKGKMLADLRVLDVAAPAPELLLLCERPALQALFDALRRF
jgi:aminomethyltransferase